MGSMDFSTDTKRGFMLGMYKACQEEKLKYMQKGAAAGYQLMKAAIAKKNGGANCNNRFNQQAPTQARTNNTCAPQRTNTNWNAGGNWGGGNGGFNASGNWGGGNWNASAGWGANNWPGMQNNNFNAPWGSPWQNPGQANNFNGGLTGGNDSFNPAWAQTPMQGWQGGNFNNAMSNPMNAYMAGFQDGQNRLANPQGFNNQANNWGGMNNGFGNNNIGMMSMMPQQAFGFPQQHCGWQNGHTCQPGDVVIETNGPVEICLN